MIFKSLSRKSGMGNLVNYVFKDNSKLSSDRFMPLTIRHNIRGRKKEHIIKAFEENNKLRKNKRANSVAMYHNILSFHGLDNKKITPVILKDIAKEYIKLHGKDHMFLISAHVEKDHLHLHCLVGGNKYMSGEASRLSKKEFSTLKTKLQEFQKEKYPELEHSLPEHGKGQYKQTTKDIRETKKGFLQEHITTAYETATSQADFIAQLKALGHELYFRNDVLTGVRYEGTETKFRLNKFGYDREKLAELDKDTETEKELQELSNLRDSSQNNTRDNEDKSRFVDVEDKDNREELDSELEEENDLEYER